MPLGARFSPSTPPPQRGSRLRLPSPFCFRFLLFLFVFLGAGGGASLWFPETLHAAAIGGGGEVAAGGGTIGGLILFVSIALGASFLCSVLEAVLLSTTASHVELQVERGRRSGLIMRRLMSRENIDRSIAAILTLNTIAHTVGAAGAGAEAAAIFGSQYIGWIGAILTVLILVVSEIIPKTLGAVYWKPLNPFTAYATLGLVKILFPIVWLCQRLTDLLKPKSSGPMVTRSELEILARLGHEEGTIGAGESRMFQNLLNLDQEKVKEILTPRTVLFTLDGKRTAEEVVENESLSYSRIPLTSGTRDTIQSFVLRFEILAAVLEGRGSTPLEGLGRELQAIPDSLPVGEVLERFVTGGEHMFLVIDEFGGTAGIVTLEDAIESLLGVEITDESDLVEDLRALAKDRGKRIGRKVQRSRGSEPPKGSAEERGKDGG